MQAPKKDDSCILDDKCISIINAVNDIVNPKNRKSY